jgi:hypothetical protein
MLLLICPQRDHSWIVRGLLLFPGILASRHSGNAIVLPVLFQQIWPLQGRPVIGGLSGVHVGLVGGCACSASVSAASASGSAAGRPCHHLAGMTGGALPVEKEAPPHRAWRPVIRTSYGLVSSPVTGAHQPWQIPLPNRTATLPSVLRYFAADTAPRIASAARSGIYLRLRPAADTIQQRSNQSRIEERSLWISFLQLTSKRN